MSGHFEGLILVMGAGSVLLAVWLANKMKLVDDEGIPTQIAPGIVPYGFWLLGEVVKSNLAVGRIILSRDGRIAPEVLEVEDGQSNDVARTIFANCITLTPGTVTLESDGKVMRVHALRDDIAGDVKEGEMSRRVAQVDGAQR